MNPRLLVKGLVLMASLAAIGWGVEALGLAERLNEGWFDAHMRGENGVWVYLGLGALAVAVGLPRQAVCFLGGYGFGLGEGLLLGQIASLFGCLFCFTYARLLGRDLVRHRFADRLKRLDDVLHEHPLSMTTLIRFLPVGSNLITNLLAGVSSVRPWPFLAGSFFGYLPQTVIFVLLGSGIHVQPVWRTIVSVALFIASAAMGVMLYRRMRHEQSIEF